MINVKKPETILEELNISNIQYRMKMYDTELCELVNNKELSAHDYIKASARIFKERNEFYMKYREILEVKQ